MKGRKIEIIRNIYWSKILDMQRYYKNSTWHLEISQKMFNVVTIASDACITPSDYGLANSFKDTCILLDVRRYDSCDQIQFWMNKCCIHNTFQRTPKKKKSMLFKSGDRGSKRTGPPGPIQLWRNTWFKCSRTRLPWWGGVPSCWKPHMVSDKLWYTVQ